MLNKKNEIILVDNFDNETGTSDKEKAHRQGLLHRAFSVFLYDGNRLLIQKRAEHKYHSGGLWANTCCSHPKKNESLSEAVKRRLYEETGICSDTEEVFSFVYRHKFNDELYEYEFDHVFIGEYAGEYRADPEEISEMKWIDSEELEREMAEYPDDFACWFRIAAPGVIRIIKARESRKV